LDILQNPDTPRALNYRGYATRKLGRTDEGISYYLKSVALDPAYPQVREYLGEAYVIQGGVPNVSSHSHERNSTDGRVREPKPHDMDLQISCGLHSEMSAQGAVSGTATYFDPERIKISARDGLVVDGEFVDGGVSPSMIREGAAKH
jgi:hypothetical protein